MALNTRTFFFKAVREAALFLGYDYVKTPYDANYWRPNYQSFDNLSNPFDDYTFTVDENGTLRPVTVSLAELCLFQEDTFTSNINFIRNKLRELSTGENAIISLSDYDNSISRSAQPNFRLIDTRWNDPRGWFSFPHSYDVYRADVGGVAEGVPIPKVSRYVGFKPTSNLFSNENFSRDYYINTVRELCRALTQVCLASNIHPGLFVLGFIGNTPGPNFNDYAAMDRIAGSVASNRRSQLAAAGVYDIDGIIRNPRPFWAHPIDGDIRDFNRVTETYAEATGIPLDGTQSQAFMAYATEFGSCFRIPTPDSSGGNARIKSIDEIGGEAYYSFGNSIDIRSPYAANYHGVRRYSDSIGSFMALVNICNLVINQPPQLLLHAGMSLHNALLKLSFRQLGASLSATDDSYQMLWQAEVNARRDLPQGEDGYNVPFQPDLTWQSIGTLGLAVGNNVVRSGNPVGLVIGAAGALIREMQTPAYGAVLARAPSLEYIRQDGSKTLDSTIYRGYTPRNVISCIPVMRTSR